MLNIKTTKNTKYGVFDDDILLEEFNTNVEAWKALDRRQGEPINKSEQKTDWFINTHIFNKGEGE